MPRTRILIPVSSHMQFCRIPRSCTSAASRQNVSNWFCVSFSNWTVNSYVARNNWRISARDTLEHDGDRGALRRQSRPSSALVDNNFVTTNDGSLLPAIPTMGLEIAGDTLDHRISLPCGF